MTARINLCYLDTVARKSKPEDSKREDPGLQDKLTDSQARAYLEDLVTQGLRRYYGKTTRPAKSVKTRSTRTAAKKPSTRKPKSEPSASESSVSTALVRAANTEGIEARTLAGGRVSFDMPSDTWAQNFDTVMGLTDDSSFHRGLTMDINSLDRTSPMHLLDDLIDVSPEVSRAFFDFHSLCNPGREIKCLNLNSDSVNQTAQKVFEDEVVGQLVDLYGSEDVVYDRIFTTVFMRGGAATETVLAPNVRDFVDLATPDPAYFEWHRVNDPLRGVVWHTGQRQSGEWVDLDLYPTFKYIPFHPKPGKPRGRSLATPAIYVCVFLMSLLHDLKRVIQQQGYPRIDISIDFDKLKSELPTDARNNPEKLKAWARDLVTQIKSVYRNLKPDDTYIHSAAITVNTPNGALSNLSLGALDSLIQALERMATRALKTMPILMALGNTVNQASSNREWEIHTKGINRVQHLGEAVLENAFNIAMRARGVRCRVKVRFAELRASEMLRDAQVDMIRTLVGEARYQAGYWSQNEAAFYATGKDTADQQEPRSITNPRQNPTGGSLGGVGQGLGGGQPDPGAGRFPFDLDNIPKDRMAQLKRYAASLLLSQAAEEEAEQQPPVEDLDEQLPA